MTALARLNSTTLAATITRCEKLPDVADTILDPLRQLLEADSAVFLQFRHDCSGRPIIGENAYIGRNPGSLRDYASGMYVEDPIFLPVMAWSDRWHHFPDPILCHLSDAVPQGVLKNTHYFQSFLRPYRLGDVLALAMPVDIDGPQMLCVGIHRDSCHPKFGEIHALALEALAAHVRAALSTVCLRSAVEERNAALEAVNCHGTGPDYAVFDSDLRVLSASAGLQSLFSGDSAAAGRMRAAIRRASRELIRKETSGCDEPVSIKLPDDRRTGDLHNRRSGCEQRFVLTVEKSAANSVWSENRPDRISCDTGLTGRELDVARLVVNGLRNRDIADELGISVRTVENHLRATFEKLSVESRTQLISRLYRDRNFQ